MSLIGEGNGNPLQYSWLVNPVDRGAWWAAVHRVTQSRTQLKRLSMHACVHILNKIIHFSKGKMCHISLGSLCIPQRYTYIYIFHVIFLWGNVYNGVKYIMYISFG